ncbi:MAG: putative amidophosphoribosyltransferase [Bacteroidetes bacterium]|nr:MAG: putative amidophosphoribosyltransferase [Bacteroidota bacterium]
MRTIAAGIKTFTADFFSLIYPQLCPACDGPVYRHEKSLCTACIHSLPRTGYHLQAGNPVSRLFYGRVPLEAAAAFLVFQKDGRVQQMIHQLKYKGNRGVGVESGALFGTDLKKSPLFADVSCVIPVPLHSSKLRKRGYNQAACFAEGIASSMQISCDTGSLIRRKATATQTRKNRFDRWQNVEEVFAIGESAHLENRHILLVDDVITTGATLEACAVKLLEIPGTRVSIAALAAASL